MSRITETLDIATLFGEVDGAVSVHLAAITRPHLELVGAGVIIHADTDTPTLCDVFVNVAHRRLGVATELVRAAKRWTDGVSQSLYLHVKPENSIARQLYESEGFEYTGEEKEDGSLWMISCAWGGTLVKEGDSNG